MLAINTQAQLLPRPLVLITDDEESICKTLAQVLEDESYATISAHNGYDALELVKQYKPELVFLDIWMPGWDGIETLEKIKQISPETKVVMISGHATVSNALEAAKRGAFDLIEKPLDIESIVLVTRRALGHHAVTVNSATSENQPAYSHSGVLSTALKGRNLGQRTLRNSAILYGHCLHSGQKSGLVLQPLALNSGIHFAQIGDSKSVPAFVDFVDSTSFCTIIRSAGISAATIEHLMSALHAYKITNLLIKCNGEVPIFDGSAKQFCDLIEDIGIEEQGGDWFEVVVDEYLSITESVDSTESISIEPADTFSVSYELNYPAPVGRQFYQFTLDNIESFKREIAEARTFGFMQDIERLQKAGLAAGGRLDNFILIDSEKIVNTSLRYPDELARHKVLDAIGDLFLLGRPLRGKVCAKMTGHSDNIALLAALRKKLIF